MLAATPVAAAAQGAPTTAPAEPAFSNTTLFSPASPAAFPLQPGATTAPHSGQSGNSEPAIAFGGPGNVMAVDGLGQMSVQVNLWKGHFGETPPAYFGAMDTFLPTNGSGRTTVGDGDADVEVTSAGTVLLADLDTLVNRGVLGGHAPLSSARLGVSVTRCPAEASGPSGCTTTPIDVAGADRQWITTNGENAWLSYHDSVESELIRVWRSTDDGRTWTRVASPISGQGGVTGDGMANNRVGPIVADPQSGNVYEVFMTGEASAEKGKSEDFNNVYVSRSTDGGESWKAQLVYHAPRSTNLSNFWPTLAVDPATGVLWTAWSDEHGVWASSSSDKGDHWSAPLQVSPAALTTTVMPTVAARDGKVDVVYYGSTADSVDEATAVWNVYDAQLQGGAWTNGRVSNAPNHVGKICLEGEECTSDRELLDLFEVAEDPATGKAAVVYTDTTTDTWTLGGVTRQLPQIVLAYEQ
ncbi:sialidase family protein [Nocardioides sp. URHA0032]|uniref:sialidase family protein n=1 Tax=Nocardioides sp. URHA0032 TaxID=1380388 RepID=UPI0012DEB9F4|nr:sialidase family protein [Nocardioides sp. URHA0032]